MEIKNVFYKNVFGSLNYKFDSAKIYGILSNDRMKITIFMELLRGFIKPTSGYIENNKEKVYLLFDDSIDQIFNDTVKEEILYGLDKNIDLKTILDRLELNEEILEKNPFTLSMGEKRKIVFASMLAANPDVILIDNFFGGIDYYNEKLIIDILKRLQFDDHKLIIMYDQNIDRLFEFIDNVLIIDNEIIMTGNKFDVFRKKCILQKLNIELPKYVEFSNTVLEKKQVDLGYRDRISDIMKDVYDNV